MRGSNALRIADHRFFDERLLQNFLRRAGKTVASRALRPLSTLLSHKKRATPNAGIARGEGEKRYSPLRDVPPRIGTFERDVKIERAHEVVPLVVRLLDQHAKIHQRKHDVTEVHRLADPPVIEHQT